LKTPNPKESLTAEQIQQFHEIGYLVLDDIFSDEDLQTVIDGINGEVDGFARKRQAEGKLENLYEDYGFEQRLAKIVEETGESAVQIWDNRESTFPAFFSLLTHERFLNRLESLLGEEIICSSIFRLRPKAPNQGQTNMPWHQDSAYFEPFCDSNLILSAWVPLVDTTEENGCLWFLPKSHKSGVVTHNNLEGKPFLRILQENLPKHERPICVPVKKGSAVIFTNRTPHCSFENHTDQVRWAFDFRYQSTQLPTNAKITRLENEITPETDPHAPISCRPPDPDFLVRSKKRTHEVITTVEAFMRLREEHGTGWKMTKRWEKVASGA
jgi:phytanoyl-CoA hydroxylase